jgi:hypothetical protein
VLGARTRVRFRADGERYPPWVARTTDDLRGDRAGPRPAATGVDHLYAGYFVLQSLVGVGLWVAYGASPTVRSWTGLVAGHPAVTTAFAYPDLAVIVVGSLLSAWAIEGGRASAVPFTAFTAGAVVYPTVYLLGWVSLTHDRGTATLAMMLPPALLTSWISYQIWSAGRHRG